jgi:hypothetical protein
MSAMTLFGKPQAVSSLLAGIQDDLTDKISGSGGNARRISIEGVVFREVVNGKEVRAIEDRSMNVVLINAAPVSRSYYDGQYVKGQKSKPACWSSDATTPDADVPAETRQAKTCRECPQDIKGSGQGDSRACRYGQRVAVMLDGALDRREVYQIHMPAMSVFGSAEGGKMGLQAYGRHLKAHNTHAISIVTEMRFDIDSSTPKLIFKPVRPLEEEELRTVLEMREHPDTVKAITTPVYQMDRDPQDRPAAEPPKAEKPKAIEKPKAAAPAAEEVPEPKKVKKTTVEMPAAEPDIDLASIAADWDD